MELVEAMIIMEHHPMGANLRLKKGQEGKQKKPPNFSRKKCEQKL
jgi:hypothetical protein